jgi:hypothetical protein
MHLAFAAAVIVALAEPAAAQGTVTIGSNLGRVPNQATTCAPGCTFANTFLAPGSAAPGGLQAPTNGTIVRWRIRADSPTTAAILRVIRFSGLGNATGVSTSTVAFPPPNATSTFVTHLPIAIGDSIGLDCCMTDGYFFVNTSGGNGRSFWDPPLVDGAASRSPSFSDASEVAINADIEPSATISGAHVKPKKGGKLRVTMQLPNAGTLLAGDVASAGRSAGSAKKPQLLKSTSAQVAAPGPLTILIKPTKAAKSILAAAGKLKAKLKLVFTPIGGSAATQIVKVKLKR